MIRAENITKSYNGEACLKGIGFEIAKGEFVSVMGKSGSGKTTLLEIMAGVRRPDGGKIYLDNEDITTKNERELAILRRTKLGIIFQQFHLISTLKVKDNILLPLTLGGAKPNELLLEICSRLEIDKLQNKYPDELSGGQKQRVAIARALGFLPKILLLDEPTGSLDTAMGNTVLDLLCEVGAMGTAIVQVTHNPEAAERGNRIIKLSDGRIV